MVSISWSGAITDAKKYQSAMIDLKATPLQAAIARKLWAAISWPQFVREARAMMAITVAGRMYAKRQ
jgi:hypothetical protein